MSQAPPPVLAPPGFVPEAVDTRVTPRTLAVLGAILAVAAFVRFYRLDADLPAELTGSRAELQDGAWYLAEPADAIRGLPLDVPPQYRKPVYTALGRAWFGLIGVGLIQANALAAVGGVLLVLFVFLGARRAFGTSVGLAAATFAAASYVLAYYGRTPVVYGWLASLMALSFWLFVEGLRRPVFAAFAWAVLALAGLGLKETAIAQLAPALAVGHLVAARRRGVAVLVAALGAAAGVALALALDLDFVKRLPAKLAAYAGDDVTKLTALDLVKRFMNFFPRSRLAFGMPVIAFLGFVGVLLATAREAPREGRPVADARLEKAAAAALAAWVVATLVTGFPIVGDKWEGGTHPPLRYFLPVAVPLAILAAHALARLGRGYDARVSRAALAPWALVLGYALIYGGLLAAHGWLTRGGAEPPSWFDEAIKFKWILRAAVVLAALATWLLGRRLATTTSGRPLRLPGGLATAAVVGVLALVPDAVRVHGMLTEPADTFREANGAIAKLLPPGSRAIGNWAHALTYESPDVARSHVVPLDVGNPVTRARLRQGGFTHIVTIVESFEAMEAGFNRHEGAALILVATFQVRGEAGVRVYRFPWAPER